MIIQRKKLFLSLGVLAVAVLIFIAYFYWGDYFTLEKLQGNHVYLQNFVQHHYILSVVIYMAVYAILVACALPIIMPMALAGGFLYGFLPGLFFAQLGCLFGSLISFLALRYIIAHWITEWNNDRVERFNQQINKYGYSYLLMLHFLSIIPLFVINLLAAMAKVPLLTIVWVTLLGSFPLNFLCVLAGQRLSSIHSFKEIFTPTILIMLGLLALIACAPLFIKKIKRSLNV